MPSSFPPWLQSRGGLLTAGGLLVFLLIAVPGFISKTRSDAVGGVTAADERTAGVESQASDPLAPVPGDWLADEGPTNDEILAADPEAILDCLVQPYQIVEIGSQTIGLIQRIDVERGDPVEAGQVLVELEADVERAGVDLARLRASLEGALRAREESLALSAKRRERGSELFESEALSVDTLQELDTQARLAELELLQAREARQLASVELRQAEALLARRVLRAPISGVVTEQHLRVGEIVDEETILKVAQVDPLRVDVLLPASRFGTVTPGMRATIEPEFPVDASVVAEVSIVDPIIDAASGTFSVQLDLPNPDGLIPGGLHCTVKFLDE